MKLIINYLVYRYHRMNRIISLSWFVFTFPWPWSNNESWIMFQTILGHSTDTPQSWQVNFGSIACSIAICQRGLAHLRLKPTSAVDTALIFPFLFLVCPGMKTGLSMSVCSLSSRPSLPRPSVLHQPARPVKQQIKWSNQLFLHTVHRKRLLQHFAA